MAAGRARSCSRRSTPSASSCAAQNPVRLLQEASAASLRAPPPTTELLDRAAGARGGRSAPTSTARRRVDRSIRDHPVAFLCAEYGVHVSLPVYSGGLGALAGDLLKEASDRRAAAGRRRADVPQGLLPPARRRRSGWQHEYWIDTDPERLPAALVTGATATPLTITVPIGDARRRRARIWRVDVGRVPLFLLDTDCPRTGRSSAGSPAGCTTAIRRRGWRSTRCSGSAASARCARSGIEPGVDPPQRGPRGARAAGARARRPRRRPLSDALDARARADRVHHPHAGARPATTPTRREQVEHAVGRLAVELGRARRRADRARPRPSPRTRRSRSA